MIERLDLDQGQRLFLWEGVRNAKQALRKPGFDDHMGQSCCALCVRSQGVEPVQQVRVAPPSRWFARSSRAVHLFECAPLGFEGRRRVVVGRVETDMPEQTSDHRYVDPGGDQLD